MSEKCPQNVGRLSESVRQVPGLRRRNSGKRHDWSKSPHTLDFLIGSRILADGDIYAAHKRLAMLFLSEIRGPVSCPVFPTMSCPIDVRCASSYLDGGVTSG